jgi:uncharacterized membrane protein YidH (DUF202 family)
MLAIVGVGAEVNKLIYGSGFGFSSTLAAGKPAAATRVQALTNQASWSLMVVIVVTAAAAAVFTFSHWYRLQRAFNRGEEFVVSHPWFDILLVAVLTSGIVLTRSVV